MFRWGLLQSSMRVRAISPLHHSCHTATVDTARVLGERAIVSLKVKKSTDSPVESPPHSRSPPPWCHSQATPVTRRSSRWDQSGGATPVAGGATPGGIGDTPKLGSKWDDETPRAGGFGAGETPSGRKKSRWDQVGGWVGGVDGFGCWFCSNRRVCHA